jgi:hypothetical protein
MKKILFICATALLLSGMAGCEKDNIWGDGLEEMEHVYYIGFYKTNVNTDALNYEIAGDGSARWRIGNSTWNNTGEAHITSPIPLQLSSERIRPYDAVTYFWVTNDGSSTLNAGTDYIVLNESGSEIPSASGAYAVTWPQTKKGIQNIKIKRLTTATGTLKVNVLDPSKGTPNASDLSTTVNHKADQYEIRGFTFDYNKVTILFN